MDPLHKSSSERRLLRATPVILAVSLVTFLLGHWGWLSPVETTVLDTWLRLKQPEDVQEIVIVEIADDDYAELFHQTSPLDPQVLRKVIDAIAKGGPRVIGVDLDTSAPSFATFEMSADWPAVIWARDAQQKPGEESLRPSPILGGANRSATSGLSLLPQDRDGIFRRYRHVFPAGSEEQEMLDSFPWAIAKAYLKESQEAPEEEVVLNFSGDRYAFRKMRASHVLQLSESPGWRQESPVRGKICLLGGTYRAARDEYPTPLGPMAGVQLMAQAVATDLRHGGIGDANELAMILLEMLGGYFLVVVHHRFRLRTALIISLIGIPTMAMVASYLAFSSFGLWANAVPLFTAVLIHQLYDHAREYRKMMEELSVESHHAALKGTEPKEKPAPEPDHPPLNPS